MLDHPYEIGLNQENDVLIDWKAIIVRYTVLTPEQALSLADLLIKHAKKSKKWKPS